MKSIRIGTRGSALARWQSGYVASSLSVLSPDEEIRIVEITSAGDTIVDIPLSHVEGTGFFTGALEESLLKDDVDVAVHSHKDLPIETTEGLVIAAVPARGPVEDVLVARDGMTLETLPKGARVGTCSARRSAQVLALRPDLQLVPLRGNVPTRVARVRLGDLDAIVLARAGLVRLGLEFHITEILSIERVLPAPAQGALAIQCRASDTRLRSLLKNLENETARRAVEAERALLHALRGGCSVPVGALARCEGPRISLVSGVFGILSGAQVRVEEEGEDPQTLGERAARRLLAKGADKILAEFGRVSRVDHPLPVGTQA